MLADLATSEQTGDAKAAILEMATVDIAAASGGTWQAAHLIAADGSHVFAGRLGEVVAVTGDGRVYRGGSDSWSVTGNGIALDYSKLVKV